MKKTIFTLVLFCATLSLSAQKQEKIFYDKDWKGCEQEQAEYYRLVTFDINGKPIGKIKDYFITGELQSEIDGALYIDKTVDSNSKWIGKSHIYNKSGILEAESIYDKSGILQKRSRYYENGNKKSEGNYTNGELEGLAVWYYENGNKETESNYKNGLQNGKRIEYYQNRNKRFEGSFVNDKLEGLAVWYYENGNKKTEGNCKNGLRNGKVMNYNENGVLEVIYEYIEDKLQSISKYYENGKLKSIFELENEKFTNISIHCDEYGECEKRFLEDFSLKNNINWQERQAKNSTSQILEKKGMQIKLFSKDAINIQTIDYVLNNKTKFDIQSDIESYGNATFGITWGCKNGNNYNVFLINPSKQYSVIYKYVDGIQVLQEFGYNTSSIKKTGSNNLRILKKGDTMFFIVNSKIVYSCDFITSNGNGVGFYAIGSNNDEVLFKGLYIAEDVTEYSGINPNFESSEPQWKGNGSGFFVDYRGYIATNYHVIENAKYIEIDFIRNGKLQSFKAKVIQSDKQNDLAILQIDDNSFKPFVNIPYNFYTDIKDVGSNVFALGYPIADVMGNEIKFTDGKISAKTGIQGDIRVYQISVPIQAGNSGGALFDYEGNLVGITSSSLNREYFNSENVNYAIKTSYLKSLIDVLPVSLRLPNDKTIATKTLTEKIKILSDYVVLIKVR